MDCPLSLDARRPHGRRWLWVSGLALNLAAGCAPFQLTSTTLDAPLPEIKTEKRTPQAITCVTYGDFRAKVVRNPVKPLTSQEKEFFQSQARRAYQQALTIDDTCTKAYLGLGRLYQDMEQYDRAVDTYKKGLEKLPKEKELWYELGMCQARRKDWNDALGNLRKALELDPENHIYVKSLGFCLARDGHYDESYACFEKTQGKAKAHYNLARMMHHMRQEEGCKQHLRLALKENPDLASARNFLAALENPATSAQQLNALSFDESIDDVSERLVDTPSGK